MPKVQIKVMGYRCERCSHEWVPRGDPLRASAPRCKSPYWDRKRQRPRK